MLHELERETKKLSETDATSETNQITTGGSQSQPPEPKKPKNPKAVDTAKIHDLPEPEFRERLERLKQNPLFQKLKRLGVVRGRFQKGELEEKDIDKIIGHKQGEISGIVNRYEISEEDYSEFFYNKGKQDFDINSAAKLLNGSREDAYRLFSLSKEVKSYYDDKLDEYLGNDEPSSSQDDNGDYAGNWTEESYDSESDAEEETDDDAEPASDRDHPVQIADDKPIAEITESGIIKSCKAAGPHIKWIFNLWDSRERLNESIRRGLVTDDEHEAAQEILNELATLNSVRTRERQFLDIIVRDSGEYFRSGKYEDIRIRKQKDIAKELGLVPSVVSRMTKKFVKTPHGNEPLVKLAGKKGLIVALMIAELEMAEGKLSSKKMADKIEEGLRNSSVNRDVNVSEALVSSRRPQTGRERSKKAEFLDKFYRSRKIKTYVKSLPESVRSSLRKSGSEELTGKVDLHNYKPNKVFANFIDSKIAERSTIVDGVIFSLYRPTAPQMKEIIKQELNFDADERSILNWMNENRRRSSKREPQEPVDDGLLDI